MRVAIFSVHKEKTADIAFRLEQALVNQGFSIDQFQPDVVIPIGGDGTLLKAVAHYSDMLDDVSFMGINNGTLGFFYDHDVSEIDSLIHSLKSGALVKKSFPLIDGVLSYGEDEKRFSAVNEIRLSSSIDTLECSVFIDDEFFEDFTGNGLIACSSLGSTGLAKSFGGALISFDVHALELVSMAPISNRVYRQIESPIVLEGERLIRIQVNKGTPKVFYDNVSLEPVPDLLEIMLSKKRVSFLWDEGHTYPFALRKGFLE